MSRFELYDIFLKEQFPASENIGGDYKKVNNRLFYPRRSEVILTQYEKCSLWKMAALYVCGLFCVPVFVFTIQ
jgi:hypothetical protein